MCYIFKLHLASIGIQFIDSMMEVISSEFFQNKFCIAKNKEKEKLVFGTFSQNDNGAKGLCIIMVSN